MQRVTSEVRKLALGLLMVFSVGVAWQTFSAVAEPEPGKPAAGETATADLATATFGSGCFWCTESDFDKVKGVTSTTSGYMGGSTDVPDYRSVSSGSTGHAEVLQVKYDPKQVTYQALLDHYWRTTDVVDGGGQFCDRGSQYRPIIFAHTDAQLKAAQDGKSALDASKRFKKPIAVEIQSATPHKFTAAEHYHQDYHNKSPVRYKIYRYNCGRDARLRQLWAPATN